jgi:dihydrofolate reductase
MAARTGVTRLRRVELFVSTSLDGYIAGPGGDLSWRFDDADYGCAPFRARVDTLLMGRRTYEATLSRGPWPYGGRRTIVFTHRGDRAVASPDTVATSRAPAEVVAELRVREGKSLGLVGGGALAGAFFDAGLVDDLVVSIHPVILGAGTPLVAPRTRRTDFSLVRERRYPSGLVQLAYRVERAIIPGSGARPA